MVLYHSLQEAKSRTIAYIKLKSFRVRDGMQEIDHRWLLAPAGPTVKRPQPSTPPGAPAAEALIHEKRGRHE